MTPRHQPGEMKKRAPTYQGPLPSQARRGIKANALHLNTQAGAIDAAQDVIEVKERIRVVEPARRRLTRHDGGILVQKVLDIQEHFHIRLFDRFDSVSQAEIEIRRTVNMIIVDRRVI